MHESCAGWIQLDGEFFGAFLELKSVVGTPFGSHSMPVYFDALQYAPKPMALEVEHPRAVARLENQRLHVEILHAVRKIKLRAAFRLCDDSLGLVGGAQSAGGRGVLPRPMGYLTNGVQLLVDLGP